MKKSSGRGLIQLTLAGVAVVAVASTPLLGSAAGLANSPFAIKAVNSQAPDKFFAIKPFLKGGTGSGSTTPTPTPTGGATTPPPTTAPTTPPSTEPTRAPDPNPDLFSMTLNSSLTGCNIGGFNLAVAPNSGLNTTPVPASGTIAWGDGSTSSIQTGDNVHNFKTAGTYQVKVTGKLAGMVRTTSRDCIQSIDHFGENTGIVTMESMFQDAANIQSVASPPTSLVNTRNMFKGSKFNGSTTDWVLPNLQNAASMFESATNFNGNLNSLNPKNLTDATNMFKAASAFNGNVSAWKTPKLTLATGMFQAATKFNQDLSQWNVSAVTDFSNMFYGATSFAGGDLNGWNTGSAVNMKQMFYGATPFIGKVSKWNTANVKDMSYLFAADPFFEDDLSSWNVGNVTAFNAMFSGAKIFNGNIGGWDTHSAQEMGSMFSSTDAFNSDISNWDVRKVSNFNQMFYRAKVFNQPIGKWSPDSMLFVVAMFSESGAFNQPLSSWATKTGNVTNMSSMFRSSKFNQNISNWNVAKVTNYTSFWYGTAINSSYLPPKFNNSTGSSVG